MAKYLFLAFTVVPFVELYLLIGMGRQFGVLPTLGTVIATGLLGAWLAKREGRRVMRSWRESVAQGRLPEEGILNGALVLVGGVLLVTPGVLTDVVGFLLLLPPTRRFVAARLRRSLERRMQAGTLRVSHFGWAPSMPPSRRSQAEVDAKFTEDGPKR